MKEIEIINKSISNIPIGKPFMASSLEGNGSSENIRQVLSRMVIAGELKRASRGIYVRPKKVPYLGEVMPGSEEIVRLIAKQTGEIITPHGAEAARMLQLSTQVPMRAIYNTNGTSRNIKVGKQTIVLKHVSPRKQILPGTMTCIVISALWYLGKNHVNKNVVNAIREQLSEKQFSEIIKHTKKMPAWMAAQFNQFKK